MTVRTDGLYFRDAHGRVVLLRGVNLGGSTKVPVHPNGASHKKARFYETRAVSFVGRPFPPAEADEHFGRLKQWGFNIIRFLVTWEAIEHAGPGQYDLIYLDYVQKMVAKAGEFGFYVFIDPHQDVWSRWTGGDGAPGWTLEAVGFNLHNLHETGASFLHQEIDGPYPRMAWPSNYGKLGAATMFTLFFGGERFAPATEIEGINVQTYLQTHYINAIKALAKRLSHMPHVIGYDTLNEPSSGYIGVSDLNDASWNLIRTGPAPTPFQSMRLGAGESVEVDLYEAGLRGIRKIDQVILNQQGVSAWQDGISPIWQANGVWSMDNQGPVLLLSNYFELTNETFSQAFMAPFMARFVDEIRSVHPDTLIFAEPALSHPLPMLEMEGLVNASHWYDAALLFSKRYFSWIGIDAHKMRPHLGAQQVERGFEQQLREIRDEGLEVVNGPTLIGEFGIPYDLNEKIGFREQNFEDHRQALDRTYRALDKNFLSGTLWNYTADNNNENGDQWNGEDLSIFSRDQIHPLDDPHQLDAGGRAVGAFCRPYARTICGVPQSMTFELDTRRFELVFEHDAALDPSLPTEIFVPDFHYGVGLGVEVSDGHCEYDQESQILKYFHTADYPVHTVIINREKGEPEIGHDFSKPIMIEAGDVQFRLEHQFVKTNGVTLHVVTAGPEDGELVILLHGFPEFWYGWREQIPYLVRAGYRVIAPDQRGFNLSDKPSELSAYRIEQLGKDILGLIDQFGQEKAAVIGHDWGALVTWWLTAHHPDRFSKAVILNVPHLPVMMRNILRNPRQFRKSWYVFFFQIPALAEFAGRLTDYAPGVSLLTSYSALPDTFSAEDIALYKAAWKRPRAMTSMLNWYRANARSWMGQSDQLDIKIKTPTLIIWGAQDVALGRWMANESLEWCEDGQLVFIEEATHWVQHDEPERVNQLIGRFL